MNASRFEVLLAESGLDAVIANSLENVSYLSGARMVMQRLIPDRLALLLWPADGDPAIVVCKGEDVACRDDCRIADMRSYTEFVTSPMDLLADVIAEKGLAKGRLGLELHSLPASYVNQMRERLPGATLVDCGDLMDQARMIKTPEEIEALAAAGRATERAIRGAFERASVGESEKKVADDIAAGVTAAGADVLNFMFLGTGTRSFEWHARPGATRLESGQVLHTDVAGNFIGYWSDLARTAFVGSPSPRQRDIYGRLYQTHVETLDAIRPGLRAGDLYSICQAAYTPSMGYRADSWAVSYRQIIDLSNFNNSIAVVPGGQSGHPGSRHYDDLLKMWRHGQYHPMPWDRDQVDAVAEGKLLLEPMPRPL